MNNNTISQRILKVKSETPPKDLAQSIQLVATKENLPSMTIRAVGASAVNQAVKAWIIARSFLMQKGIIVEGYPTFKDIPHNTRPDEKVSAIEINLEFKSTSGE